MILVPAVAEREFDRALAYVVRGAADLGITPNAITTAALLLNLASGILLSMGYFACGGLAILTSGMLDMADGKLARMTGQASIFGAVYDATVDRVGELALFTGIGAYLILHHLYVTSLIAVAATGGSLLISYVRARAESYDIPCNLGIMCRGARILLLGAGSTLTIVDDSLQAPLQWISALFQVPNDFPPIPLALALVAIAVLSPVTVAQRLRHVRSRAAILS